MEPTDDTLRETEALYRQSMKTVADLASGKIQPARGLTRTEAIAAFRQDALAAQKVMDQYGWRYDAYRG